MKLNSDQIKKLGKLAPDVALSIKNLQTRYHTRAVSYSTKQAGFKMYFAEGASVQFFATNGKRLSTTMISESTVGAANDGLNYGVNTYSPALPEGTWIVEFELFCGKPIITVYYVGVGQLK